MGNIFKTHSIAINRKIGMAVEAERAACAAIATAEADKHVDRARDVSKDMSERQISAAKGATALIIQMAIKARK